MNDPWMIYTSLRLMSSGCWLVTNSLEYHCFFWNWPNRRPPFFSGGNVAPAAAPAASTGSGASTFGSKSVVGERLKTPSFVGGNLKKTKNEGSETNFSCFFSVQVKKCCKKGNHFFVEEKKGWEDGWVGWCKYKSFFFGDFLLSDFSGKIILRRLEFLEVCNEKTR